MKSGKIPAAAAALVMMLATAQASADGQTYDPYDNYYSAYYGIEMTSEKIVTHDAATAALREQHRVTSVDNDLFSDPRNFYNW